MMKVAGKVLRWVVWWGWWGYSVEREKGEKERLRREKGMGRVRVG